MFFRPCTHRFVDRHGDVHSADRLHRGVGGLFCSHGALLHGHSWSSFAQPFTAGGGTRRPSQIGLPLKVLPNEGSTRGDRAGYTARRIQHSASCCSNGLFRRLRLCRVFQSKLTNSYRSGARSIRHHHDYNSISDNLKENHFQKLTLPKIYINVHA